MDAVVQYGSAGGIATFTVSALVHYFLANKNKNRKVRGFPSECEVLVIGAGVAGASAAYALSSTGVRNIGKISINVITIKHCRIMS